MVAWTICWTAGIGKQQQLGAELIDGEAPLGHTKPPCDALTCLDSCLGMCMSSYQHKLARTVHSVEMEVIRLSS